eukprot:370502-Amphidinium_carterae.1
MVPKLPLLRGALCEKIRDSPNSLFSCDAADSNAQSGGFKNIGCLVLPRLDKNAPACRSTALSGAPGGVAPLYGLVILHHFSSLCLSGQVTCQLKSLTTSTSPRLSKLNQQTILRASACCFFTRSAAIVVCSDVH